MNDTNYMDNTGACCGDDVLVANETNVTDSASVSGTASLSVPDTTAKHCKALILIGALFLIAMMTIISLDVCAAENSVYVDSGYMQEQFGNYPYYLIVTDGSGNYVALYSSAQICYNGTVFRAFCTNHYYGYKTLKVVDDYLVIDENGTSYDKWSSISVSFNSNGLPSTYKTIVYASKDIYNTGTSNTGSPIVGTTVYYSVANNIGSKPVDEPTEPMPDVSVDCKFTDENIVESVNILSENLVAKLDIIITLLLVMIALKMFSPLANNHKRGLQKKEK